MTDGDGVGDHVEVAALAWEGEGEEEEVVLSGMIDTTEVVEVLGVGRGVDGVVEGDVVISGVGAGSVSTIVVGA